MKKISKILAYIAPLAVLFTLSTANASMSYETGSISAWWNHTCVVDPLDGVQCWGWNSSQQSSVPLDLWTVKQVSGGSFNTCAILSDDTLTCWGQSHTVNWAPRYWITKPLWTTKVKKIATGYVYMCAITIDDTLTCWTIGGDTIPWFPGSIGKVKEVSMGRADTCAIKWDDTVQCWWYNFFWASSVPANTKAKKIGVGESLSCVIKLDDTLQCWWETVTQPSQKIQQLSVGSSSSWGDNVCVILQDNTLQCVVWWSGAPNGLLVKQISAGERHTCAVLPDDTVQCWWRNTEWQTSVLPGLFAKWIPSNILSPPVPPALQNYGWFYKNSVMEWIIVLPEFTDNNSPHATLSYTVSWLPGGLIFDQNTRTISWTPTDEWIFTITFSSSNGTNSGASQFTITINSPRDIGVVGTKQFDRALVNFARTNPEASLIPISPEFSWAQSIDMLSSAKSSTMRNVFLSQKKDKVVLIWWFMFKVQ